MSEWQPIETAPKDEPILIYDPEPGGVHTVIWSGNRWRFSVNYETVTMDDFYGDPVFTPTHWQPLPDPPNALAETFNAAWKAKFDLKETT